MKKFGLSALLGLFLFLAVARMVSANEGTFRLAGKTDADGRCFGTSIFVDGNYKLLMSCRGLQMALDPVLNKYVVWASVGTARQRLGEIVSGKLAATVNDKFDSLFVTLESDAYPTKPSINTVLNGNVESIDFGKGTLNTKVTAQPTVAAVTQIDDRGAVVPIVAPAARNLTSVVVGIGKAILFGFIILLIIVGVMSFLARRKNL